MSRLTTSASTGRLIKISVNFIDHALKRHSGIARRARPGIHEHGPLEYGFQLAAPLGARLRAPVGWRIFDAPGRTGMTKNKCRLHGASVEGRIGRRLRRRVAGDDDLRAVLQFHLAGGDDLLARLEPVEDRRLAVPALPDLDRPAVDFEGRLAVGTAALLADHIDA